MPIGQSADGNLVNWRFTRPGIGVCHGTIVGPKGSGKTNALNILRLEAICSGSFCLFLIDPSGQHDFDVWRKYAHGEANTLISSADLLCALSEAALARYRIGAYCLSSETPGIMIAAENAHILFNESLRARRAGRIISRIGELVGVSLVVTMPDLNIARFGDSRPLRNALTRWNVAVFGPPDSYEMLAEGDGSAGRSAYVVGEPPG